MKYLKRYNKILESKSSNSDPKSVKIPSNYYLPIKHWDYQLGDLWSPKVNIGGSKGVPFHSRNDSHVNRVDIVDDGMSNTLSNRSVQHLFSEHLGESNLDELCEFYLRDLGYDYGPKDEFSFLMKGLIEKRCYVVISVPGKPDIIQQVPDFKKNYLDIVGDIIGHKFTDKERKDISDGKDSKYYGGSWYINVGLYDVSGIKLISTDMGGNNCYILKRNDMERLIDMTKTYNLYRFEDKDLQLLRMNGRRIEYHIISDIFIDVSDNGMVLEDFNQIGPNLLMVKFMKDNAQFDDKLVKEISDGIDRFESVYNCKLYRIDLTRNNLMYVNDSNKTWLLKDRPVLSFNNPEELLSVGTMEYDVHLRKHAVYFLFEV